MEEFRKSLNEIYMNFDTIQYLKEENLSFDNIVEIFEKELDYSESLTTILLKFNKSFLRSVAVRIRLKLEKNVNKNKIKEELICYDSNLGILIDKLLNISEDTLCDEVNEKIETNIESISMQDEDDNTAVLNFLNSVIEKTDDNNDIVKEKEIYKYYCNFCKENETEELSKEEFKESLHEKMGKCTKKGYEGFKIVTI